jgi:hypothetical protein
MEESQSGGARDVDHGRGLAMVARSAENGVAPTEMVLVVGEPDHTIMLGILPSSPKLRDPQSLIGQD